MRSMVEGSRLWRRVVRGKGHRRWCGGPSITRFAGGPPPPASWGRNWDYRDRPGSMRDAIRVAKWISTARFTLSATLRCPSLEARNSASPRFEI